MTKVISPPHILDMSENKKSLTFTKPSAVPPSGQSDADVPGTPPPLHPLCVNPLTYALFQYPLAMTYDL
jgi:hypothetical protein